MKNSAGSRSNGRQNTRAGCDAVEPVLSLAKRDWSALLETMRMLVSIESGSRDPEGLARLAELISQRFKALGGQVDLVAAHDIYRMADTPEQLGGIVRATFTGTGTKKILLICHMDTVYSRGMLAEQPFRIDGNRAYGLGIANDKQGIAVILHALAMLRAMDFRHYGTLTVLINGDELISSPGSRGLVTRLGAEHDATFVVTFTLAESDKLSLTTSGIASIMLTVEGRPSHAGVAPEKGINALYELAHQVLQMSDLSDPASGIKVNWTMAKAGLARNTIPPNAQAVADVRVRHASDFDAIEKKLGERIKKQLLPGAAVRMIFERRRPPLEATPASHALAAHAQQIYRELGKELFVDAETESGGNDAAFAALRSKAPVISRLGLQSGSVFEKEYVLIDSIEPRLYLLTRMLMSVGRGDAC
jgi:glutamate carboxypeptidase